MVRVPFCGCWCIKRAEPECRRRALSICRLAGREGGAVAAGLVVLLQWERKEGGSEGGKAEMLLPLLVGLLGAGEEGWEAWLLLGWWA